MIDPKNITNYNRTTAELQEFLLFAICVAGKQSSQIAPKINELARRAEKQGTYGIFSYLIDLFHANPFENLMEQEFRSLKLGKYNLLQQAFYDFTCLDLRTCTVEDLEACHGIGPKTARFFLLHSRPNQKLVVLDTHLLKYVRENIDPTAPKQTPSGTRYKEIEQKVLSSLDVDDWANFDLGVWASYAK